jgi:hypothetical protein
MIKILTSLLIISVLISSIGYARNINEQEYIDCMDCFTNYILLSEENNVLESNMSIKGNYIDMIEKEHNTEIWYYRIGSGLLTALLILALL